MDLDSYIGRYTGETRLRRLLSIAAAGPHSQQGQNGGKCIELARRQRALKLAEDQMRRDGNALLYREIFGGGEGAGRKIIDRDPELFEGLPPFDVDWMNATDSANRDNRRVLEGRLSTAQSRLHKDAIRTAYLALAEHDVRTGRDNHKSICQSIFISDDVGSGNADDDEDSGDAIPNKSKNVNVNVNAALFRAMDFSATRLQNAQIGLLIIESAINAGDYVTVKDYAERLGVTMKSLRSMNATKSNKSGTDSSNYQESILVEIDVKVQIAKGIERMVSGEYAEAASVFVPLLLRGSGGGGEENNNNQQQNNNKDLHLLHWPGVTSPEDVALYAGLMCLVTRDRSMMLVLADHPEALELVPAVRELLLYWSRANYAPCMRAFSECSSSLATATATTATTTTTAIANLTISQPLLPLGCVVDVYLTPPRWNALVQTIRETCLVEYLRPYKRVKLESLRDLFFSSPTSDDSFDTVIDALAELMDRRMLHPTTRLDCRENILFQIEPSVDPSPNILAMEERVLDDSHAMLVRLACLEHDLAITGDPIGGRRGKAGKMSGGRRHLGQQQRYGAAGQRLPGAMTDSSDSEEDAIYESYEDQVEAGPPVQDAGDTHMIDEDPPSPPTNADMNPEDMY